MARNYKKARKTRNTADQDTAAVQRNSRKEAQYPRTGDKLSSLNDLSWYARYPDLLLAAGSLPFPYRPGRAGIMGNLEYKVKADASSTINKKPTYAIPGFMTLQWAPSAGRSESQTDPISIAAKEIYSKVRSKFSGSLDADAPDFIMYLLALDSIFAYIGSLKRIYRALSCYSPNNYALPTGLLTVLGFDAKEQQDLLEHKMEFFQYINQLVYMTRKFVCPAGFDIMNRHYWMNDNVYADAPTPNSQMYVFRQMYVYKYSQINTPDGVPAAGVKLVPITVAAPSGNTALDLFTFGKDLIDVLAGWDDSYTISGYLMRAYEGYPQFVVDLLTYDEQLTPVYVEEVLTQIENSMPIIDGAYGTILADVSQDPKTNLLLCNPRVQVAAAVATAASCEAYNIPGRLTLRPEAPSAADVVIASRLCATMGTVGLSDTTYTMEIYAGTEIPISWSVAWPYSSAQGIKWRDVAINSFNVVNQYANSTFTQINWQLVALLYTQQFDWHPVVWAFALQTDTVNELVAMGDVHNFTFFQPETLNNIHRVCIYSEFNAFSE